MRISEERIWMGMGGSVELKPLLSFKDPICPNMLVHLFSRSFLVYLMEFGGFLLHTISHFDENWN